MVVEQCSAGRARESDVGQGSGRQGMTVQYRAGQGRAGQGRAGMHTVTHSHTHKHTHTHPHTHTHTHPPTNTHTHTHTLTHTHTHTCTVSPLARAQPLRGKAPASHCHRVPALRGEGAAPSESHADHLPAGVAGDEGEGLAARPLHPRGLEGVTEDEDRVRRDGEETRRDRLTLRFRPHCLFSLLTSSHCPYAHHLIDV